MSAAEPSGEPSRDGPVPGLPPAGQAAWKHLRAGNRRFREDAPAHPRQNTARRQALLAGQQPIAAVLGCADARLAPEIIFDQGLGDLFVIRTAGHVVAAPALASLEYAARHLATPLIVVLGHSACGAITAAATGAPPPGYLSQLVAALAPAVERARSATPGPEEEGGDQAALIDRAARLQARRVAAELTERSGLLAARVAQGALSILPAYYDQASGRVTALG